MAALAPGSSGVQPAVRSSPPALTQRYLDLPKSDPTLAVRSAGPRSRESPRTPARRKSNHDNVSSSQRLLIFFCIGTSISHMVLHSVLLCCCLVIIDTISLLPFYAGRQFFPEQRPSLLCTPSRGFTFLHTRILRRTTGVSHSSVAIIICNNDLYARICSCSSMLCLPSMPPRETART